MCFSTTLHRNDYIKCLTICGVFDWWQRDKHSIILTAAQKLEELKKRREELERQKNKMLGARESTSEGSEMEEAKIRINVARPSSGIDSMLEVLKCLKQTNSNIRLIQSKFLPQQFSAVLGIETKVINLIYSVIAIYFIISKAITHIIYVGSFYSFKLFRKK